MVYSGTDYEFFSYYLRQICIKFSNYLASKFKKKYAVTAPFNGAILNEFSEQHIGTKKSESTEILKKHQSIKRTLFNAPFALFKCK